MRYQIDHDLHIHSFLSTCSRNSAQTTKRILQYARDFNLNTICLTDHFWDETVAGASRWYQIQDYFHVQTAKPLPQAEGIRFLFGCETDLDRRFTLGISPERCRDFDFIIIPTTHLHMKNFTIEEKDFSVARRAALWVDRLDAVLEMDLPFHKIGIAHLTTTLIDTSSRENYLAVLNRLPEAELRRLFEAAARRGCGIEINVETSQLVDEEFPSVLRIYRIAKECGCLFYVGGDAHTPNGFLPALASAKKTVEALDLTEADKFRL